MAKSIESKVVKMKALVDKRYNGDGEGAWVNHLDLFESFGKDVRENQNDFHTEDVKRFESIANEIIEELDGKGFDYSIFGLHVIEYLLQKNKSLVEV